MSALGKTELTGNDDKLEGFAGAGQRSKNGSCPKQMLILEEGRSSYSMWL